jgi:hypothetical protein
MQTNFFVETTKDKNAPLKNNPKYIEIPNIKIQNKNKFQIWLCMTNDEIKRSSLRGR